MSGKKLYLGMYQTVSLKCSFNLVQMLNEVVKFAQTIWRLISEVDISRIVCIT